MGFTFETDAQSLFLVRLSAWRWRHATRRFEAPLFAGVVALPQDFNKRRKSDKAIAILGAYNNTVRTQPKRIRFAHEENRFPHNPVAPTWYSRPSES
jgi:hypothetical protein